MIRGSHVVAVGVVVVVLVVVEVVVVVVEMEPGIHCVRYFFLVIDCAL